MGVFRIFDRLAGQRGNHRQHQNDLRQHHGLERKQPAQKPQRAGA
jgi:hypothetical protein